jgi:hypothetical protein
VLGSQWGDEGKGKLVDVLAPRFDIVARCQVRGRVPVSFVRIGSVALLCFFWGDENLAVRGGDRCNVWVVFFFVGLAFDDEIV